MFRNHTTSTITIVYLLTFALGFIQNIVHVFGYEITEIKNAFLFGMVLVCWLPVVPGIKLGLEWGGLKSVMGRAIISISLGWFLWGMGQFIWNLYVLFSTNEIPYPSFADLGYGLSALVFIYGTLKIGKVVGSTYGMRSSWELTRSILIGAAFLVVSYFLLVVVARNNNLTFIPETLSIFQTLIIEGKIVFPEEYIKIVLDFYYPLTSMIVATSILFTYSISRNYFGGKLKLKILIIFVGMFLQYVGDFTFSYTTTTGTYFNGYYPDLYFISSVYFMSLGLLNLRPKEIY